MMTQAFPLIIDPPQFDVTPDSPFQNTVQPETAPQKNVVIPATTLNPNTTTTVYAIPAGKLLVITSCIFSAQIETSGSTINPQGGYLLQGTTTLGAAFIPTAGSIDICSTGVITALAGSGAIKIQIGNGTPSVNFKMNGYLVDPTQYGPAQQQQTSSPFVG